MDEGELDRLGRLAAEGCRMNANTSSAADGSSNWVTASVHSAADRSSNQLAAIRPLAGDCSSNRQTAIRPLAADRSSNRLTAIRPLAADGPSGGAFSSQITSPTGYFAALSPFLPRVCRPENPLSADIVISDADSEEPQVLDVAKKRPPQTDAERARKCHTKKKHRVEKANILAEDREILLRCLQRKCHNRNQYTDENLAFLLRVGTCPSEGGARAPLANVISSSPGAY